MSANVRENRVRRMAARQGLRLVKSRRRDPRALDYGVYWIMDQSTGFLLTHEYGLDLDGIEDYLTEGGAQTEVGLLGARYIVRQFKSGETLLRTDDVAEAHAEAKRVSAWANSPGCSQIYDTLTRTIWRYRHGAEL